jgi:hypothetical protein
MASAPLLAALRALSVNDADAVAASLLEAEDGDESMLKLEALLDSLRKLKAAPDSVPAAHRTGNTIRISPNGTGPSHGPNVYPNDGSAPYFDWGVACNGGAS